MMTLIIGHPRSGKTTFSQKYEKVIHLDDYRFNCYEGVLKALSHTEDEDVVIEGVYNRATQRIAVLHKYKGHSKRVCIWLNTPLEIRSKRKGYHKHDEYFEPPTYAEGWDEIIIIGETNGTNN